MVFAAGNKTSDDRPNHVVLQQRVVPAVAEMWAHTCPAHVYTAGDKGTTDS
jgi:hypothetical protein